jgi:RNA polymerase sigma factor (sigma-70 family)
MNDRKDQHNPDPNKDGRGRNTTFMANHFLLNFNIVDLLKTAPSERSFSERLKRLGLSSNLEQKILLVSSMPDHKTENCRHHLRRHEEKELATEVLLLRHKFTQLVFENMVFRQAALTVIQNIYLFRQRKIFFGTSDPSGEKEWQRALQLFSQSPQTTSIPLAQTFQHLMVARIWNRIVSQASDSILQSIPFKQLHETVEQLNTLRNIYMILSMGLVGKLTAKINAIYRQSVSPEDARQIGSFGIARAAYRYHPSNGMRFSTYASYWVLREIQRQALEGRLIRISVHLVENFAREAKEGQCGDQQKSVQQIRQATAQFSFTEPDADLSMQPSPIERPEDSYEKKELQKILLNLITKELSPKSQDILQRRYGIGQYKGREHSVIEIARVYGVTRGSIYQLENAALEKLQKTLTNLN